MEISLVALQDLIYQSNNNNFTTFINDLLSKIEEKNIENFKKNSYFTNILYSLNENNDKIGNNNNNKDLLNFSLKNKSDFFLLIENLNKNTSLMKHQHLFFKDKIILNIFKNLKNNNKLLFISSYRMKSYIKGLYSYNNFITNKPTFKVKFFKEKIIISLIKNLKNKDILNSFLNNKKIDNFIQRNLHEVYSVIEKSNDKQFAEYFNNLNDIYDKDFIQGDVIYSSKDLTRNANAPCYTHSSCHHDCHNNCYNDCHDNCNCHHCNCKFWGF